MTLKSYRLPFRLWPLGLKLGHLFAVMNWHQCLPYHQQDQTYAHNGEGNPQNNNGDFGRFWTTCGEKTGKNQTLNWLSSLSILNLNQVNLTIYLKVVGSGPCLTPHHIKGDPALVLCHHSALHRRALVLIWEKMRVCISIRKAWIHPISSSLPTLCWDWKTIYGPLLRCQ